MKHPLFGRPLIIYSAVWTMLIIVHIALLNWVYNFPITIALVDGIVFNILLANLGLAYWYVVQYLSPTTQSVLGIFVSHVVATLVAVSITVYSSFTILKLIFANDQTYLAFLSDFMVWRLITGSLFMALVILVYYLLRYNSNLVRKEQEEHELQSMLKHAELEMLKFQINPHFIFNSLNSISSLTLTAPDRAHEMVIKLSDFLRGSLGSDNPDKHSLKKEMEQMNLYLDIEKIRFGDRLNVIYELDERCLDKTLPNMILQPLYENVIKYGLYEQLENVDIRSCISCEGGNLNISISNNYDSESVSQKGKGIGLKNVRNRLEIIYGITDLVTIEKNRHTFTVHLLIPQSND